MSEKLESARDEELESARREIERLKGTLRYIHTQAKARPSGDSLTLSVIERNADAALNDGFQEVYRAARAALAKKGEKG